MKTDPLTVYSTYMAIKLHFQQGSYDAFKFNFKGPKRGRDKFLKSPDRYTYEKIAKKYREMNSLIGFLVANTLDGKTWIRDMDDECYMMWLAKLQRLQYQFNTDMNTLADYAINHELTFDDLLMSNRNNEIPVLDILIRKKTIQVESVIILDVLTGFISRINKTTLNDPLGILSDKVYMLKQYKPFIMQKINQAAAKNTVINLFTDLGK